MHSRAGVSYFGLVRLWTHQLDNHSTIFWGNLLHAQLLYCKYPGMKLENWDAATYLRFSFYNSSLHLVAIE